jgi:drug/metabolite transporter (DMT)-like permease
VTRSHPKPARPGTSDPQALPTATAPQGDDKRESRLARMARPFLWVAMPCLGLVNQYLAVRTAHALSGEPLGLGWVATALRTPWVQAWVGVETLTFGVWMTVLSQLTLSAAYPMTALGYILIIGMGWVVFHEPIAPLQLVGGVAILAGVCLVGDDRSQA